MSVTLGRLSASSDWCLPHALQSANQQSFVGVFSFTVNSPVENHYDEVGI
jgi:hypothetical protein